MGIACFCGPVVTELSSMGGIAEFGVIIDTKASPCCVIIEKAQNKLRQVYDVHAKWRRELEFLEKGGNPLDFKFGHVAPLSVQSTSVTDQIAEQNVISEAKDNFAFAPSLYGDSVESSGKPGNSSCREGNTSDNLMLLDGDTNNIDGGKTVKRGTKRTNIAQPEQFLHNDGHNNAKEGEDSGLFHLGRKNQAYARRRSKSSSENAIVASVRSPPLPPLCFQQKDVNGVIQEEKIEDHGVSSLSDSKPTSPNCKNIWIDASLEGNVATVMGSVQTAHRDIKRSKNELSNTNITCQANEMSPKEAASRMTCSFPSISYEIWRESQDPEKADNSLSVENVVDPPVVDESSTSVQPEGRCSVLVIDEKEVSISNNAVDAQKDTEHLAALGHDIGNKEECSDLGENNNRPSDASVAAITMPPVTPTCNMANPLPLVQNIVPNPNIDIKKSNGNKTKIIKKELDNSVVARKEYRDSIIRKAQFIEANIKKSGERSLCNISLEKKRKSHWDFVLEEMVWMATDFMQERLWKSAAAAQTSHWISSTGRAAFEHASTQRKQKSVARTLASCIMNFWYLVGSLRSGSDTPKPVRVEQSKGLEENKLDEVQAEKQQDDDSFGQDKSRKSPLSPIQSYALRILEYNIKASECLSSAEAPPTPERLNDFGILIVPDQLSEANFFYLVAPGAMRAYRESVDFRFVHNQRIGNTTLKDDYEITTGSVAGDVRTHLSSGHYYGGLASKSSHKKKHQLQQKTNGTQQYETGGDMPSEPFLEGKSGNQQFFSYDKRTTHFYSAPTKRIQTAVRQQVVGPFQSGVARTSQFTSKTDASSGDANSYQDDQTLLHGGSFPRKNADIVSTMNFNRQLLYDGNEVSMKSKKKKKHKHQGYKTPQSFAESFTFMAPEQGAYDPRSQVFSDAQYDQKDYSKRRSEANQFDSNGNIVINGKHAAKKPKLMNQLPDILLGDLTPIGPIASPVASQMSNMANHTKIIKFTTRGRKIKALKMAAGNTGPGGPWSSFEDQALVVLVHDMGENWELVSDALNSIYQLKCIYRRPNECEERHNLLMEKNSGDGADNSGSSQHCSALPGIPKGSARQLFQRIQGPFEQETIKSHFEKIIVLGQKLVQNCRKGEIQDFKQINPLHASHILALSQVCPSNAGAVLTPLDLRDAVPPNSDILSIGYQRPLTSGLALPSNHGSIGPALPYSNLNSRLPSTPDMVLGSNLPSPSSLNAPSRDAQRYDVSRPASLQVA